jgi:phosphatidylserine/phosphatidylglycerophosphate/cardiolipin synthase-like enzyme
MPRLTHVVLLCGALTGCVDDPSAAQSQDLKQAGHRTDMVGELTYGQTHHDVLGPERYKGLAFAAQAGDVISAYAAGAAIDPAMGLFGPLEQDGAMDVPRAFVTDVREDRRAAHLIDHEILETGSYVLVVADEAATGGDFHLRLACTGGACQLPWLEDAATSDCALSELGQTTHQAAMAAEQSRNTVPAEMMVRFRNRAADAMLTGPNIFPTMADRIAQAESEVDIAFFVYNYSDAYDEVVEGIARLESRQIAEGATEPVIIRIVVDAMKAVANKPADMAARVFDGISQLELDPNYVQVMIATYEHLTLGNLHTKTVVIDGHTAMLGGANIQDQHDYADPWMDSFYMLQGDAAQTLLADFDHAWNKSSQWVCSREGDELACEEWKDAPAAWHPAAVLQPDFDAMGLGGACVPTIALSRTAWGGFNNSIDNPQDQGILAAMAAAKRHVQIQTPNLNDDAVRDALIVAVQRGVDVRIVLSMGFNDGPMNLLGGTNEEVAADLYRRARREAPANAHRLQIRWYSRDGQQPVDGKPGGASHLKYMSVDGQMAIVGSTNMDTIAWNHSRETNLAIDHAGVTAMWDRQVFEPNFGRGIPADAPSE